MLWSKRHLDCSVWIERKDGLPIYGETQRINMPMHNSLVDRAAVSRQECLDDSLEHVLAIMLAEYGQVADDLTITHEE